MKKLSYKKIFEQADKESERFIKRVRKFAKQHSSQITLVDIYSTMYTHYGSECLLDLTPQVYKHSGKLVCIKYKYTGTLYSTKGLTLPVCRFLVNVSTEGVITGVNFPDVHSEIIPEWVFVNRGQKYKRDWDEAFLSVLAKEYERVFDPYYVYNIRNRTFSSTYIYKKVIKPQDIISNFSYTPKLEDFPNFIKKLKFTDVWRVFDKDEELFKKLVSWFSTEMTKLNRSSPEEVDIYLRRFTYALLDSNNSLLLEVIKSANLVIDQDSYWYYNFFLTCIGSRNSDLQLQAYNITPSIIEGGGSWTSSVRLTFYCPPTYLYFPLDHISSK